MKLLKTSLFTLTIIGLFACSQKTASEQSNENQPSESAVEKAERPSGYAIGDIAEDFKLPNVDGTTVSLSDHDIAKGYIVTFTCNHCPYAVAYESRIMDLHDKYSSLGYPVIAISPNDPAIVPEDGMEAMQKRAAEKGYTFPYLLDENQEVYVKYGAIKTPHIFVLENTDEGNVVRYIGAIDNNYEDESAVTERYVEDAVDALLNGETIATTNTKAIGCSIKDNRFKK